MSLRFYPTYTPALFMISGRNRTGDDNSSGSQFLDSKMLKTKVESLKKKVQERIVF